MNYRDLIIQALAARLLAVPLTGCFNSLCIFFPSVERKNCMMPSSKTLIPSCANPMLNLPEGHLLKLISQ